MLDIAFTLEELAGILDDVAVEGGFDGLVSGIASLEEARAGDVSFLGNPKYASAVGDCRASAIFVPTQFEGTPSEGQAYLRTDMPSLALARVAQVIEHRLWPAPPSGVDSSACVHEAAQLDASAHVGPLCTVGEGTVV